MNVGSQRDQLNINAAGFLRSLGVELMPGAITYSNAGQTFADGAL